MWSFTVYLLWLPLQYHFFFTIILLLLWLYLDTSHGFPDWHVQTSSFPLIYIYYNFRVVLQRKFWQYQPGVCLFSSHNLIGNVPVWPPVCPSISTNIAQSSSQPHSHSSYYPPQTLCQVKLRATLQLKLSESFIFHNPHLPKHTLNLTCNVFKNQKKTNWNYNCNHIDIISC